MNLADLRRDYARAAFSEQDADADPFLQFTLWFDDARVAEVHEPNAMALATTTAYGAPSVRIVLLKEMAQGSFAFFTDLRSRKAQEIAATGQAALCFWWGELERQVRIAGTISPVMREEAARYYVTRPLGSRIGAHASHQSSVLGSRAELEQRVEALSRTLGDDPPLPEHWGGYRVTPREFEFWQGRPNRLHDRVQYGCDAHGSWFRRRLSP